MATIALTATLSVSGVLNFSRVARVGDDRHTRLFPFTVTHSNTVTNTATVTFFSLPPGKHRIIPRFSQVSFDGAAGTASRTISIGLGAYVNSKGETVAAAPSAIVAAQAVATGAVTAVTVLEQAFESQGPVAITGLLTGNDAVAMGTLSGFLAVRDEG